MTRKGLLATGLTGTVITAVCCFTPALVIVLAALGITAMAWLDLVLLPLLAVFLGITAYALVAGRRA